MGGRRRITAVGTAVVTGLVAILGGMGGAAASQTGPPDSTLEPRLAHLAEEAGVSTAAALSEAASLGVPSRGELVGVVLDATDPAAAAEAVARAGGRAGLAFGGRLRADVPPAAVDDLARDPAVDAVRAPASPVPLATTGNGIAATGADAWHAAGVTGRGIRIAVIDVGFAGLADSQASGDLPPGLVLKDFCAPETFDRSNHGTKVAEIVHEMAPDAELHLVCIADEVGLGLAGAYAAEARIDVINHSVAWFNVAPGDGTGPPGSPNATVDAARAAGILWVNAAGASAQQHWAGAFTDEDADSLHEFGGGDEDNGIWLYGGDTTCAYLRWDRWPTTDQDFDLFIRRASDGAVVAESAFEQAGGEAPVEMACVRHEGAAEERAEYRIEIASDGATAAPRLDLFFDSGYDLEHQVAEGSVVDPATSPNALAVGAVCWATNELDAWSSRGPTADGRLKPDLVAPAGVWTSLGVVAGCPDVGLGGTSWSAAHASGAAALVHSLLASPTPAAIEDYLRTTALDLGPAGPDNATGAGTIRLAGGGPAASTGPASQIGATGATVSGTADGADVPATFWFEYGTGPGYGSRTPPAAAGWKPGPVSTQLTGLAAATRYHYRAVVETPFGTAFGEDGTFTTEAAVTAPPGSAPPPPAHEGGGGAAAGADLEVVVSASRHEVPAGETVVFVARVAARRPHSTASGVVLTYRPPGGTAVLGSTTTHGPGCRGTLVCDLDSIAPGTFAEIRIVVRPAEPGDLEHAFTVTSRERDVTPGDNAASLRTLVRPVRRPAAGPDGKAGRPTLRVLRRPSRPAVLVRRASRVVTGYVRVAVDEPARLFVSVRRTNGGKLTLLPGTRVGKAWAAKPARIQHGATTRAGWLPLRLRLPAVQVRRSVRYVVVITAVDADGQRSTTTLRMRR